MCQWHSLNVAGGRTDGRTHLFLFPNVRSSLPFLHTYNKPISSRFKIYINQYEQNSFFYFNNCLTLKKYAYDRQMLNKYCN